MKGYDVAIVGAGIIGLAHAYIAAKRGLRVLVLEQDSRPLGASIRNFGLQLPLAQKAGENYTLAVKSQQLWREVAAEFSFWSKPNGLLVLSLSELENEVMREFIAEAKNQGYNGVKFLYKDELRAATSSALNFTTIEGAIYSTNETVVNPGETLAKLVVGLKEKYNVEFVFNCLVQDINGNTIKTNIGMFYAERILLCTGESYRQFFPELVSPISLKKCKLQVMKLDISTPDWRLEEALASGISMLHYSSFSIAPSLAKLREYYDTNHPEINRYGIHILAVENNKRELIVGDSHEYDDNDFAPGIKTEINEIILSWLDKYLALPPYKVKEAWAGCYLKNNEGDIYCRVSPSKNIQIINGVGGQGMTIAFGLAEETFNNWV